jgi:2-oxo-3-hexenedioate decarboxylase
MSDARAIAASIRDAFATGHALAPPSSSDPAFDLRAAYAVEAELARERQAGGHSVAGWKVGYANKAVWRALKLQTLVWAHMYDDTVQFAADGRASLRLGKVFAPKLEPEIVFKLNAPLPADLVEPVEAVRAVEWFTLGFEIIDCPYPDWQLQPVDFVAAFGLHRALIVGRPLRIDAANLDTAVDALARFTLKLSKDDQVVEEGSATNVLRSPLRCLIELGAAMSKQPGGEMLRAGDLISSGTITTSQLFQPGQVWRAEVEGLDLSPLTLQV